MFEKTQTAVTQLTNAITEDVTNASALAKAMVIPTVAGLFGNLASYANKVKEGIETGDLFKAAEVKPATVDVETPAPTADPLPTMEQNITINLLRKIGKTDEEIASTLGVSIRTVAMAS
jgi:DNA-binding NarL/FixJ family response regulator